MALVPSTFILSAGVKAPDFTLPDPRSGKEVALADLRGSKGTLIVFACNHCPYVVHLAEQMGVLADEITVHSFARDSNNFVITPPPTNKGDKKIIHFL